MQAIGETIFHVCYLSGVIILGIIMIRTSQNNPTRKLFGIMAVVLGCGDAFHLVPRAYALIASSLEENAAALGVGKFVTSITMTVFYMMLYYVWRRYFKIEGRKPLTITLWVLAVLRVGLCFLPQNEWLIYNPSLLFGILRNIPFAIIGVIIIVLFAQENKKSPNSHFKSMPLAISLSFAFYIPVVLFAGSFPLVGMLMIPKTLAYVWIVWMGFKLPTATV